MAGEELEERQNLTPAKTLTPTWVGHTQVIISDNRRSDFKGNIVDEDGNILPGGDTANVGIGVNHIGVVDQNGGQMKTQSQPDIMDRLTDEERAWFFVFLARLRTEEVGPAIEPEPT